MLIEIVVLDLAEVPVIGIEQLNKGVGIAVEREADLPDAALFFPCGDPFLNAVALHALPRFDIAEHMHQVAVDIIRLQARKLLIEKAVDHRRRFHQIIRQLRRDHDLFAAVIPRKDLAEGCFAARIDIGGIEIVHAVTDRGEDLALRLRQINAAGVLRKTHTSVSQNGYLFSVA